MLESWSGTIVRQGNVKMLLQTHYFLTIKENVPTYQISNKFLNQQSLFLSTKKNLGIKNHQLAAYFGQTTRAR